jgi:hypothetical protein
METIYTVQLYLPSSSDGSPESRIPAEGGATRFLSHTTAAYCDVEPTPGRVLVFQHEELLHTGEEVRLFHVFCFQLFTEAQVTGGIKCAMRCDILYKDA